MRLLLDTQIFLWYITNDAKLPVKFLKAIRDPANEVYLSVASIWEMVIKYHLGKLLLPHPPAEYLPRQRPRTADRRRSHAASGNIALIASRSLRPNIGGANTSAWVDNCHSRPGNPGLSRCVFGASLNDTLHLPGPLVKHCVARNRNAAPGRCKGWFAGAALPAHIAAELARRSHLARALQHSGHSHTSANSIGNGYPPAVTRSGRSSCEFGNMRDQTSVYSRV
ncbi:hypothetical protein BH11PLA2_BH11PLA2_15770 [soil metagenome]